MASSTSYLLSADGISALAADVAAALTVSTVTQSDELATISQAPVYSASEVAAALVRLLPTGPIWRSDPDSAIYQVMLALAHTYVRQMERSANLLVDAFPTETSELLSEWEASLGLPDPCAGDSPSTTQRRNQVVARFVGSGGPSKKSLIAYAAALGYTITIFEYAPARAGLLKAGDPLLGRAWAYAWAIHSALNTVTVAKAGAMVAGDPLRSWGNAVLECEMSAIKPAHTVLIFQYS